MTKKARFSELTVDRLVVRDPDAPSSKTFVIEGGHKDRGEHSANLHIRTRDGEIYAKGSGTGGSGGGFIAG